MAFPTSVNNNQRLQLKQLLQWVWLHCIH